MKIIFNMLHIVNYSQHSVHYIPKAYLLYKWNFVISDPFTHFAPHPPPLATTDLSSVSMSLGFVCVFYIPHVREVIQYLSLRLTLLSPMPLTFFCTVTSGRPPSLLLKDIPFSICTMFLLSTHPPMDTWVVSMFWLL